MKLHGVPVILLGLGVFLAAVTGNAQSRRPRPPQVENELVIRLHPSAESLFSGQNASAPPRIVEEINRGRPPAGLDVGNPRSGRLAIGERARGRVARWIQANPNIPAARLQRYIVISYPAGANLDAIERALENNPYVEDVARNVLFDSSAIPSDEYAGTGTEPAGDAQWGIHRLKLPEAWDWTTGHAYLGFVDEGLETGHPELRAFHEQLGTKVFDRGSFREHLSRDTLNQNCSVDEADPNDTFFDSTPGHGSHTMGIAAAASDNTQGVAGGCWDCSVMMVKASPRGGSNQTAFVSLADGLSFAVIRGPQSVNMSFGISDLLWAGTWACVQDSDAQALCDALQVGEQRDVVMVAASGNHRLIGAANPEVDFPASDSRTVAVGGLELQNPALPPVLWVNESCQTPPIQCGSWIGPGQDLVAPAQDVLSTVYAGFDHEVNFGCGDSLFLQNNDGYGLCTGTSMSAPFVTAIAGLVRSVNPLLTKQEVRDVLTSTASIPGTKDPELGHGIPDAEAAVRRALGSVGGQTLTNRLTPLFTFYSPPPVGASQAQTHVATTVPQVATALLLEDVRTFNTVGAEVASYDAFPQFCTSAAPPDCCPLSQGCDSILVDSQTKPRASAYIFTNDRPPTSFSPPLVPLYRLRYESAYSESCPSPFNDPISPVRDFAYAVSDSEVETYLNGAALNGLFQYQLDGIEGYLYQHCDSGCPPGVISMHRLYNPSRHDMVIVPQPQVASFMAQGYLAPQDPNLPEIAGWAFPNSDQDTDGLIDGFERLIGSNVLHTDSDGDGVSDGVELLTYDTSDPDPTLHGYGDPCSNGCPIFVDGFESGNTSAWSASH